MREGEAFYLVGRDEDGNPISMEPLNPDDIEVIGEPPDAVYVLRRPVPPDRG